MAKPLINEATEYVENNISRFHEERIDKLETLKLSQVLAKKNPYLFRAKKFRLTRKVYDVFCGAIEHCVSNAHRKKCAVVERGSVAT
jgi:hypothetical protein